MSGIHPSLLEFIGNLACPECATRSSWHFLKRPKVRQNSITAGAACGHCGNRIFIKRLRGSSTRDAAATMARQSDTYRRLSTVFGCEGPLRVPMTLGSFGDIIALEFIDGSPGNEVLRHADHVANQRLVAQVGEWFGRFHGSSDITGADVPFVRRLHGLREDSRQLARNEPIVEQTLRYLDVQLPSFTNQKYECVLLHGDAKPGNFLVDGPTIVGIDVDTCFRGLPEEDIAQFLTQCAIDMSYLGRRFDDDYQDRLDSAFLDAYKKGRPLDMRALNWLRGYFLVSFWKSMHSRNLLHRLRWTAFFRHRLERYLLTNQHPG